jgi:carbamoyl-phosphate synthase small subunit
MTYPHIGNYGVNSQDVESFKPHVEGFVVRELSPVVSNYRAEMSLDEYLKKNRIVGIEAIDTRMLTKHLRDFGSKKGIISTVDLDKRRLVKRAKGSHSIVGVDLVKEVTCQKPYEFKEEPLEGFAWPPKFRRPKKSYFAVCVDGGIKFNILRKLNQHGFRVKVVPAFTTAEEILGMKPDGVFYSNGPGDPEPVRYLWSNMQKLIGKIPVFGICLGHQMLALALGGKTFKLKFGHRGGNHPVMDLRTRKVEITAQNHGFCADSESLPDDVEITHVNLNDKTLEGMRHKKHPVFSVQYHPETSPGPHDSDYLFDRFYDMVDRGIW